MRKPEDELHDIIKQRLSKREENFDPIEQQQLHECWLRATEWLEWPLFVSQTIIPLLLLFIPWHLVIMFPVVATWLWSLVRYKFVSFRLATVGENFSAPKWPIAIICAVFLLVSHEYVASALSALWPLVTLVLQFFVPGGRVGTVQSTMMTQLGYTEYSDRTKPEPWEFEGISPEQSYSIGSIIAPLFPFSLSCSLLIMWRIGFRGFVLVLYTLGAWIGFIITILCIAFLVTQLMKLSNEHACSKNKESESGDFPKDI